MTRINDVYESLRIEYKQLGDVTLEAIIINFREHEGMHITDSFFAKDLEINAWSRVRRRFTPENKDSWKPGVLKKEPIPINSLQPVIFPMHCNLDSKVNNHWTLVVRYPTENSSQKDWDFVLVDSANNDALKSAQREAFDLHTTLHLKRDHG